MVISRIYIKDKKLNPIGYVQNATLLENLGLLGDIHSTSGNRQISILSEKDRIILNNLDNHGLCSLKFIENITIKDLEANSLKVGDKIEVESAILEITEVGKRCFSDCNLFNSGKLCILSKGAVYAKVIKGGKISVGHSMKLMD